jgi:hypothetical protein
MKALQPSKLRRSERFQAHSCKRVGSEAVQAVNDGGSGKP